MTQRHEFQLHVCPICAAPVEVEGGYDGPYYVWTCDHEHVLPYPLDQPERMTLDEWADPVRRERIRSESCRRVWEGMRDNCEQVRKQRATVDYEARYRWHPIDLPYWPQYRRLRREWRLRSATSKMNEVLKRVYSEPLREHLQQKNLLFGVMIEDETEAVVNDVRRDLSRQTYGDTYLIPMQKKKPRARRS